MNDVNPRVLSRVPIGNLASTVTGTIVNDHPFNGPHGLLANRLDGSFYMLLLIAHRSYDYVSHPFPQAVVRNLLPLTKPACQESIHAPMKER
jgi:hypothetical protein